MPASLLYGPLVKRLRPVSYTHLDVYKRQRQQWGILHNGGNPDAATPRVGRRFSDCKPLFLVKIMTVTKEKAPANYVPAAAVIRREQALSGFTGCKGCVGG